MPPNRIAVIDTRAPTGIATPPAMSNASGQEIPCWSMCPAVAAPTAAKDIWHREICPDIHTSMPSDANTMK